MVASRRHLRPYKRRGRRNPTTSHPMMTRLCSEWTCCPRSPDRDSCSPLERLWADRYLPQRLIRSGRAYGRASVEIHEERLPVRTEAGAGEFDRVPQVPGKVEDL